MSNHSRSIAWILLALALTWGVPEAHAASSSAIQVPDGFFRAFVNPDNSVAFGYTMPAETPKPDQVAEYDRWWVRCAKHKLLLATNADYKTAYLAVAKDPVLQSTGITFAAWSTASLDEKDALRGKLKQLVTELLDKHGLRTLLETLPVNDEELATMTAKLRAGEKPVVPLIRHCPGADGNIAVNPMDPDFPKLEQLRRNPATAPKYDAAIAAFRDYLDRNPTVSIKTRTTKLNELIRPLLDASR